MYFTLEHDFQITNLGRLYAEDTLIAYTLDPQKLTSGLYTVDITYSNRFKTNLPHIYNEKFGIERGFRIHAGNTIKDSEGCILVGDSFTVDLSGKIQINNSRKTLEKIMAVMNNKNNKLLIL